MKTPVQELLDYTTDLLHTFDSEKRVAMAVLDYLKTNKKSLLEKEKEVMCQFAKKWDKELSDYKIRSAESCFDETFNNEER